MTTPIPPTAIAAANDPVSPPFGAFAPTRAQAAIIALAQRSRLKRGAFRPMLSRLVNLLRAGPVDVPIRAPRFASIIRPAPPSAAPCSIPTTISKSWIFCARIRPAGGVFVDVGANVGTYAMVLARQVGTGGKVIAIEPHPITHARLAFNRAASGFAQVLLVAAAAGPADGELMIETDGDNLGASHIVSGERVGNAIAGAIAAAAAHSRRRRAWTTSTR